MQVGLVMMTGIMQKNSVQKLKGLLNDRYGLGLQITSMVNVANMDVGHLGGELRGSSLSVPICARGKYLATAILSRADSLSKGDLSAVSEMVRLVLEPALFSLYLERQELNVRIQDLKKFEDLENVYSLPSLGSNSGWSNEQPEFSSSLILLESFNPHTISRVAIHIHETGKRWALIRYSEIRHSLNSVQDIREMGPMTLLVEDLLQLSPEAQLQLVEFAQTADPKTEPLILIGSTSSLDDLNQREVLSADLARILLYSRLELDRMPKEFSKLQETIEIALDKHALIRHTLS